MTIEKWNAWIQLVEQTDLSPKDALSAPLSEDDHTSEYVQQSEAFRSAKIQEIVDLVFKKEMHFEQRALIARTLIQSHEFDHLSDTMKLKISYVANEMAQDETEQENLSSNLTSLSVSSPKALSQVSEQQQIVRMLQREELTEQDTCGVSYFRQSVTKIRSLIGTILQGVSRAITSTRTRLLFSETSEEKADDEREIRRFDFLIPMI